MSERSIFKCGVYAVPVGVKEFTVAGLELSFTPASVIVSVRQPATASLVVSAYVTGTPGTDGFSVVLSSPVETEGYFLDWQAFAGTLELGDADTLSVSYNDLMSAVADFLGRPLSLMDETERQKVDSFVQSGVRNFYYPPKMEGVDVGYEWTFRRMRGNVSTQSGISSYVLPDGMGHVLGQITYEGMVEPGIPVIPYGELVRMQSTDKSGKPRFAAVISRRDFSTKGQRKEMHFFPVPDAEYSFVFECDTDDGKLSDERPYPLGGPEYAELITESCLAVAEQRANDEAGLHTDNFNRLLVSAISRDRKSSPQNYGMVGDRANRLNW